MTGKRRAATQLSLFLIISSWCVLVHLSSSDGIMLTCMQFVMGLAWGSFDRSNEKNPFVKEKEAATKKGDISAPVDHMNLNQSASCMTTRVQCNNQSYHLYSNNLKAETAHCITGDVRTLCSEIVYMSIKRNLLTGRENDVYIVVSQRQTADTTFEMCLNALSELTPVLVEFISGSPMQKHLRCFDLVSQHTMKFGLNASYRWLTRVRPDTVIEKRIPDDAFDNTSMSYLYDIMSICPFSELSRKYPCFPPNSIMNVVGKMPAVFDNSSYFQLSFERMDHNTTMLERHFAWMEYYVKSLTQFYHRNYTVAWCKVAVMLCSVCWR